MGILYVFKCSKLSAVVSYNIEEYFSELSIYGG